MSNQIKLELQEVMGTDRSISEAAWTSSYDYQKKQSRTEEDVKRVINLLADSKHSVPFESVIFRFWMRIPISTDRQLMTHRIASHSGMSGRYRTMPDEFLAMPEDVKDIFNKISYPQDPHRGKICIDDFEEQCKAANYSYDSAIVIAKHAEKDGLITNKEYKRLREVFRNVLPQGNMTERVTIMNLRSFCNFIKLRTKEDAQPEIRDLANKMLEAVKQANNCPIALEALERNGWSI